jgi:hypothetical protein
LKQIENTFSLLSHLLQDFALFLEPYASEISSVNIIVDRASMVVLAQQESSAAATPSAASSSAASVSESEYAEHDDHDKLSANSTIRSSKIAIVEFINEVTSKLCIPVDIK